jgi:hypothetical protein
MTPRLGLAFAAAFVLVAACTPGETTFVLELMDEQPIGDDDDSADPTLTELVVRSRHDVTCPNDDAWARSFGGDLLVVQGGSKVLTVAMDSLTCDGLPDELSLAQFLVRWTDDAVGVFGLEVTGEEATAFGVDLLGPGEPLLVAGFDFDAERTATAIGGAVRPADPGQRAPPARDPRRGHLRVRRAAGRRPADRRHRHPERRPRRRRSVLGPETRHGRGPVGLSS